MLVTFTYKNHRAEISERTIEVQSLDWEINPPYGYQPGWFLRGICQNRKASRSFALTHIVLNSGDMKHFAARIHLS